MFVLVQEILENKKSSNLWCQRSIYYGWLFFAYIPLLVSCKLFTQSLWYNNESVLQIEIFFQFSFVRCILSRRLYQNMLNFLPVVYNTKETSVTMLLLLYQIKYLSRKVRNWFLSRLSRNWVHNSYNIEIHRGMKSDARFIDWQWFWNNVLKRKVNNFCFHLLEESWFHFLWTCLNLKYRISFKFKTSFCTLRAVSTGLYTCIWAGPWEMCLISYVNNKGADQPAHPRSLISAFVVRCLDSVMSLVSVTKISSLILASVAEQASLSLTWSETPEDTHGAAHIQRTDHDPCKSGDPAFGEMQQL